MLQRLKLSLHELLGENLEKEEEEVSWPHFLLLIKRLDNLRLKQKRAEEMEVAEEMDLEQGSLRKLQECFESYDDKDIGAISKNTLKYMFSTMEVTRTQEQRKVLRNTLEEVGDKIDFAQFLRILHSLDCSKVF
eukprot:gnl/MRDRNA2_/MRDRNA2_57608_c0_seq1.p1 gnl/MRDRNA2_/MRDRNA2_57608_c0~~gnl/MRDRNA2_/MRDRNA2_57608_c0_seq1.p1  ORF type:complete len:134 (+),score=35.71 gnl/MRDRNA2_/MRDRNA2_57608_c0_seq1:142-543(+)